MNLSLIIPVYNEQDNLPMLFEAIYKTMPPLGKTWEVILVDDGSRDNSLSVLEEHAKTDPEHVRVISFRRNFGQTAAIAAGLDYSQGDIIVLLDADKPPAGVDAGHPGCPAAHGVVQHRLALLRVGSD